ncbi:CRISPR-associated helicase Cas3' [Avibacterium sp. 21-595]|uniref:CRISPR-associated helicase Cas3' n=1 Tax=Avibacterium sp. 21-595 TaxID=2911527 RepID=UPI0020260D1C|nr:CRISPR-associated helicase Cas3' [Avibacterium sp. 21-595]URL06733.1 CRISPR-associated helicase Cas3' [Avibacterium sp. 21-595]
MSANQAYANTKGQLLSHHLYAVGYLAAKLVEMMGLKKPKLIEAAFYAGLLHDIGKLDQKFQRWITEKIKSLDEDSRDEFIISEDGEHIDASHKGFSAFSFEKHPRHNEISWLLTQSLLNTDALTLNDSQKNQIMHTVYWHHTRPFRKEGKLFEQPRGIEKILNKNLPDGINALYQQTLQLLKDIEAIGGQYFPIHWQKNYDLQQISLPPYKSYDDLADKLEEYRQDIKINAHNNLIRTAVISADRIISAQSAEELAECIAENSLDTLIDIESETTLKDHIHSCLTQFERRFPNSQRNLSQSEAVNKLIEIKKRALFNEEDNIAVLQGPAGCGKTKIALEWALKTDAKQIIWICPRVQVCLGLVHDLTQADYLPNAQIELFTGEYKKILTGNGNIIDSPDTPEDSYFSGDIVITTIDQIVNNIISHNKITSIFNFMKQHIIFDEFHEIMTLPAFNLLFAELIEAKKATGTNSDTLLISATPNYFFIKEFLGIPEHKMVSIPSFNPSRYQILFESYDDANEANPLISRKQDETETFVITNTAKDAQYGFLHHQCDENNILLHSKYSKTDKAYWFDETFKNFKENGSKKYQTLRSGPIVQASLNISCNKMLTEITTAENWLQRLGRLDRFGKNNTPNPYITVIPKSSENGKQTSQTAKFLNQLHSWRSAYCWLNYLKNNLDEGKDYSLNELYALYASFYQNEKIQSEIEQDIEKLLKHSVSLINQKVLDPISIAPKRKQPTAPKIAKNSLRGDNRFVQMAECFVDEQLNPHICNEYAYEEDNVEAAIDASLTESRERIEGYGDSGKNLLAFMQQKHHNIKGGKKIYKDFILLNQARSPESPIYLSYTPDDLRAIGGDPHSLAIYYVKTTKQPVGIMNIDNIKSAYEK